MGVERGEDKTSADEGRDACLAGTVVEGSRGTMFDLGDGFEGFVADREEARRAGRVNDD